MHISNNRPRSNNMLNRNIFFFANIRKSMYFHEIVL